MFIQDLVAKNLNVRKAFNKDELTQIQSDGFLEVDTSKPNLGKVPVYLEVYNKAIVHLQFTTRWGPSPNGGPLRQTPPWLRAFMRSTRVRSLLSGWLVQSGLGEFPLALVVPASVLGQLTLWLSLFWFGPTVTVTTTTQPFYSINNCMDKGSGSY